MTASANKLSLEPLIKWPGGKRHVAKRLIRMFPEHDTYVEPFAGAAAVFFRKPLVGKNVIGDYDPWLIDLYKGIRNGGLAKCSGGIKKSKGLFKRALKNNRGVCHKVALSALSFHGDRATYTGEGSTRAGTILLRNRLRKHWLYKKKLRRAYVCQGDYASTMRKFDGPGALHFLDPPWLLEYSGKYKGRAPDFSLKKMKDVSERMKGHVFIIINNHPKLRKLFCHAKGWKCNFIKVRVNKGNRNVTERQLVIQKGFGAVRKKKRK